MPASAMILVIFRWAVARGPGPEQPAGCLCRRRAERVDELESAEQLGRDGNFAPALGAALQSSDSDRGRLEVDVQGADGQGLGDLGAGVGEDEGEGLVSGLRRPGGDIEEAAALAGGQVLPAAGVDELEIADQARHFA